MLLRPSRPARGDRPSGPVTLNRDSPLARGLSRLYPLNGDLRSIVPTSPMPVHGDPASTSIAFKGAAIGGLALDVSVLALDTTEQIGNLVPSGNGTIAWWAMPTDLFSAGNLFMWGQNGSATPEFSCQRFSGTVYTGFTSPDTRVTFAAASTNWIQYAWQLYTFTWVNGGTCRIYHNGRELANAASVTTSNPTGNLAFGSPSPPTTGSRYQGLFAHIGIWNRELTAAEVWQLYEPSARWDMLWVPSSRTFFDVAAAAAAQVPYQPQYLWAPVMAQ